MARDDALTRRSTAPLILLIAALAVGAISVDWLLAQTKARNSDSAVRPSSNAAPSKQSPELLPRAHVENLARAKQTPLDAVTVSREPHPMTPLHEAMAAARELIFAAVHAIHDKNYAQARRFLTQSMSSSDPALSQAGFAEQARGYLMIIDCLEAQANQEPLSSELSLAAQHYTQENRLTPRRQVRRVCLEGRPFERRN